MKRNSKKVIRDLKRRPPKRRVSDITKDLVEIKQIYYLDESEEEDEFSAETVWPV